MVVPRRPCRCPRAFSWLLESIARVCEIVAALCWTEGVEQAADGVPCGLRPCRAKPSAWRGRRRPNRQHVFDRVQVGAVGRQIEDAGAGCADGLGDACDLVRREVVHDHNVTGLELGSKELADISEKRLPVIGPSSTSGAMMPAERRPVRNVMAFQCPCGAASTRRSPRGLQHSGAPCWSWHPSRRGGQRRQGP